MLLKLKKHHIGIIVDKEQILELEKKYSKKFNMDETQGTRVLFIWDEELDMYREYIVREGRVKNSKTGFAHFCYSIENIALFNQLENYIKDNALGYPVTKLEKSESEECGWVRFYFIKNQGLIELNLLENLNV